MPATRYTANTKWDVSGEGGMLSWRLNPPQLFVLSFVLLILAGTLGLKFLPGLYTGQPLSWADAFFTSTSAVCITGLMVVDLSAFTFAGQAYLLLLVQIGGLGMLTFTSLIMIALGRRLSLQEEALTPNLMEDASHRDARRLLVDILRFTFIIEGIGALLLYLCWIPKLGWIGALWPAVFHSVTAFCNAGLSTFEGGFIDEQRNYPALTVVMLLVIAGGIGFLVMDEIYRRLRGQTPPNRRLSLHSRLVLFTSAALTLVGWGLYLLFEWNEALAGMTPLGKVVNALFMSVTARSAGFNTVDYAQASDSGNFLTIILMTIGGSPGSTAGGIKTTTFALLGILAWSRLRGYRFSTFVDRSLREETTDRAIGVFVITTTMLVVGIFLLNATEHFHSGPGRFLHWMFEASSAFNTAGLSMGVTSELSRAGRWTIAVLMFLGRVGPLTIAAALTMRRISAPQFRFAYEDVMVG